MGVGADPPDGCAAGRDLRPHRQGDLALLTVDAEPMGGDMTTARLAITTLRPHYGREPNLIALLGQHLSCLRELGLATQRQVVLGRTDTNEVVEVFEWASSEAISAAESNPAVLRIMRSITRIADFVVPATVPAARELFFELTPIDPDAPEIVADLTFWHAATVGLPAIRSESGSQRLEFPAALTIGNEGNDLGRIVGDVKEG